MGQLFITDDNKSPLVAILVLVLLSTSVMTVITRVVTKRVFVGKLTLDDNLVLISGVSILQIFDW